MRDQEIKINRRNHQVLDSREHRAICITKSTDHGQMQFLGPNSDARTVHLCIPSAQTVHQVQATGESYRFCGHFEIFYQSLCWQPGYLLDLAHKLISLWKKTKGARSQRLTIQHIHHSPHTNNTFLLFLRVERRKKEELKLCSSDEEDLLPILAFS